MKIKKFFLVQMIVALVFFYSCEKKEVVNTNSDLSPNSEIILKDGALNFQTVDAFFEMDERLGSMTDKERQDWENSIGFVSMRTELINVFEQIDATDDETTIEQIVSNNSDIVELINGDVYPIIKSSSYAAITNRKGIFFVNGVIHKVERNKIASSEDGNEQTVTKALQSNLRSVSKGVNVVEYLQKGTSMRGDCGTRKSAYEESGRRKCDFEMITYKHYCEDCCGKYHYRVISESRINNYRKNWRGRWVSYNTDCTMKDRAYTISVPIVTGYNGKHSEFYYSNITHRLPTENSSYDCSTMSRWSYVGDRVENIDIKTPRFSRVKGRATNRGIGNIYAVINCGSW